MARLHGSSSLRVCLTPFLIVFSLSISYGQVEIREEISITPKPPTLGQESSAGSAVQTGEEVSYDIFTASASGKVLIITTPLASFSLRKTAEVSASCSFPANPSFCDEYRVELNGAAHEVTPGGTIVTTVDALTSVAGCSFVSALLVIHARDQRGPLVSQFDTDNLVISGPVATFYNSGTLGGITAEGTVGYEIPEDSPYASGKVTLTTIEVTADPIMCWGDPFLSSQFLSVDAFDQAGVRWQRCVGFGPPLPDPIATIAVTGRSVFLETLAGEQGTHVEMPLSLLMDEGILLVVDENANIEGDSEAVTVSVTAGNVVGAGFVTVFQEKADIEVVITPSEVQPGGSAAIEIFELLDGDRIPFPDDRKVSIVEGETFGTLRSILTGELSDEFISTTDPLEFVANEDIPEESAEVVIRVESPAGGIILLSTSLTAESKNTGKREQNQQTKLKYGKDEALSLRVRQNLIAQEAPEFCQRKFEAESIVVVSAQPVEIVLSLNPSEVRPSETGGNNTTTVTVLATQTGTPVQGISIVLERQAVDQSGGHSHDGDRPAGFFLNEVGDPVATIERETGTDGEITVLYESSKFGGEERIIATLLLTPALGDMETLTVSIPDLKELEAGENYTLIGGTARHLGPPVSTTRNDNHWGVAEVIESLVSIANAWAEAFPNEARLMINDISLPQGGGFDVLGNWDGDIVPGGAHQTHRKGTDVDIRTEFPDVRAGVVIRVPRHSLNITNIVGNERFETICRDNNASASIHGGRGTTNEHYHLDF